MTTVLDDFNRADGALGGNWTNDPNGFGLAAAAVASNRWSPDSATWVSESAWNVRTFGPACEVICSPIGVSPPSGYGEWFVTARLQGLTAPQPAYVAIWVLNAGSWTLTANYSDGVDTFQIGASVTGANASLSSGDRLAVQVRDSGGDAVITVTRNGVTVLSVTDSPRQVSGAGYAAIGSYEDSGGANLDWDDFGATTLAAPPAAPPARRHLHLLIR